MRRLLSFCVVCVYIGTGFGVEAQGVAAFAGSDSSGHRYGGTYELKDEEIGQLFGFPGPFGFIPQPPAPYFGGNNAMNIFFPQYFRTFENIIEDITMTGRTRQIDFEPLEPLEFEPIRMRIRPMRFKPFKPLKPIIPPVINDDDDDEPVFKSSIENQMLAANAARKAFDLTYNQAGFIPNYAPRSGAPDGASSRTENNGMGSNIAFASGAIMPGRVQQAAIISSPNPALWSYTQYKSPANDYGTPGPSYYEHQPGFSSHSWSQNIYSRFSDDVPANPNVVTGYNFADGTSFRSGPQIKSVSSRSFSSSTNINGKPVNHRMAETVVNNDGRITKYKVVA